MLVDRAHDGKTNQETVQLDVTGDGDTPELGVDGIDRLHEHFDVSAMQHFQGNGPERHGRPG
ncbi:hypothetical protein D3C87_1959670 [compost metagenome]